MRLDKYLKVSRIIKRRTVANEACSMGRVTVNDKVAKPAADVNPGDIISVRMADGRGTCCARNRSQRGSGQHVQNH